MACGADESTTSNAPVTDPFLNSGGSSALDGGSGSAFPSPGSSNTGSQTGAGGTGGGSTVCEAKTVGSGRVTPDMLIVLDRSGSMKMGNVNRWDPSVSALKQITAQLGATINFGLMAFPGMSAAMATPVPMQDCSTITDFVEQLTCIATNAAAAGLQNVDTCGAGSIDVPIAPNNGTAIASALDRMSPNGATPTAVTLQAAHTALGTGAIPSPDAVVTPKYVLLVTDGAPNCTNNGGGGGGRGGNNGYDAQAVDQSVAEIAAMAKDGIKTYVIGYNTKSDAQLSAALDRMALAGDTGDKQHHAIEDGMALVTEFQKIAGAAASCEFVLNTQPSDPSHVEVKLDGKQINLNDPNGWLISTDRRRVTLQGSACAAISSKDQHTLSVRVLCEPVQLQ